MIPISYVVFYAIITILCFTIIVAQLCFLIEVPKELHRIADELHKANLDREFK